MKVILVNGGPHKEGCTYTALREVADALEQDGVETEIFWLGNDPVAGCIDCGYCKKTDRCFRNDCVNEFLEKAEDADGFVFGTPVHFASAAGALISFLDRAFYGRDFSEKVGAAVISCRRAALRQLLMKSTNTLPSKACPSSHPATGTWFTAILPKKSNRIWKACRPCGFWAKIWLGF